MSLRELFRWSELTQFPPHSGPTMTLAGTAGKVAILGLLFFTAAFFSWKHFYARAQQLELNQVVSARTVTKITNAEEAQKVVDSIKKDMQLRREVSHADWQYPGAMFTRELSYPLFAWFLFFLGLAGIFSSQQRVKYLAPVCVVLEGIAFGSLEIFLQQRFPGMTFTALALSAGLLLAILLAFRLGVLDGSSPFALVVIGILGAIAFTYLATGVLRSFGYPVAFPHARPESWKLWAMVVLTVEAAICIAACRNIRDAIESGAPKWLEWQAAVRIFVSFLEVALAARWLVKRTPYRAWRAWR